MNGAGSMTITMHYEESPLNDYSVGSALLKPTGFDLPSLQSFEPAAWIAAPVLKRLPGIRIPFIEKLPSRGSDVSMDDFVFLRPTQSEAVLLQFGDLCIVRGNQHVGNWPVLRNDGFPARTLT